MPRLLRDNASSAERSFHARPDLGSASTCHAAPRRPCRPSAHPETAGRDFRTRLARIEHAASRLLIARRICDSPARALLPLPWFRLSKADVDSKKKKDQCARARAAFPARALPAASLPCAAVRALRADLGRRPALLRRLDPAIPAAV